MYIHVLFKIQWREFLSKLKIIEFFTTTKIMETDSLETINEVVNTSAKNLPF